MTGKSTQGRQTREQQKRVFNGDVNTKGGDPAIADLGLQHDKPEPISQPEPIYDVSSGDRSITPGANDRGDHKKTRSD
ncbi:MAG: hypothetical protein JWQ22_2869 [Devosia sp.]|nr:hypothetical protein [Devosia sp.]